MSLLTVNKKQTMFRMEMHLGGSSAVPASIDSDFDLITLSNQGLKTTIPGLS